MDKVNFPNHMYKFIIIFKDGIILRITLFFFKKRKNYLPNIIKNHQLVIIYSFRIPKSNLKYYNNNYNSSNINKLYIFKFHLFKPVHIAINIFFFFLAIKKKKKKKRI